MSPYEKRIANFAAMSPDGSRLVWGNHLRDAATGKPLLELEGIGKEAQFSPDGKRLLSLPGPRPPNIKANVRPDPDQPIHRPASLPSTGLWDVATGKPVGKPLPTVAVAPVAFSPDSSLIAFAATDVRLWDAITGEPRWPSLPVEGSLGPRLQPG